MKILKYISLLGALLLIIISSAWVAASNDSVVFFFSELNDYLKEGADSHKAARDAMWKEVPNEHLSKIRARSTVQDKDTTEHVTTYYPKKAYNGLTFYVDYNNTAHLINMKGEEIHKWTASFSQIWPEPKHVDKKFFGEDIAGLSEAHLLPNGDILALYSRPGISPWGGGLARLDKNSKVVWTFNRKMHHWLDVSPDGRIFALEHRVIKNYNELLPNYYKTPYLQDSLFVLDLETGKKIKRIPLVNAILRSDYKHILNFGAKDYDNNDILHANDVDYITKEMAANLPFAEEGQVLLSFHRQSTIAILDIESEKIVWAQNGLWSPQHDPDILEDGTIMLLQNHADTIEDRLLVDKLNGKISRVLQYDPLTKKILWDYIGTMDDILYTEVRGEIFPLPNENILITEHDTGRMIEITKEKEVVWEFVNPTLLDGNKISGINASHRFTEEQLPFLKDIKN